MKTTFVYRSLFLLTFGILLFVRPVSAEETERNEYESLLKDLTYVVFVNVNPDLSEETSQDGWLSWFKKENLAVRGSFFGGRTRHSADSYNAVNANAGSTTGDRFRFDGRTSWGGEFGIGYKIGYGIELGISYMFMEVNDYHGLTVAIDSLANPPPWYNTVNMDIDSRAAMFNARVYLDELTGIKTGRFSPYIFAGAGRATHKVTDHIQRDDPTLNGGSSDQFYNSFTSHNNKGEFAYRCGLGTLFKLTDHVSIDASASFMDWGEARASRFYANEDSGAITTELKPIEPDVRTIQGSIGIQFNF